MVSKLPESLCSSQTLSAPNTCSSMIFWVVSSLAPSRRQVINLSLWRVRSSRPPIRKAACCATGILRCNTGRSGPAGRVHIFCTWAASRVRHSRSEADISGRGTAAPGIGRPLERTSKQNWSRHIIRRRVIASSRFDVWWVQWVST